MTALTDPGIVLNRLEAIENDLAIRQNSYEAAALAWFRAKREKEHARAVAFMKAEGTVAERQAQADMETARIGMQEEAAVMNLLQTLLHVARFVEYSTRPPR
jgi:hypothetical protein